MQPIRAMQEQLSRSKNRPVHPQHRHTCASMRPWHTTAKDGGNAVFAREKNGPFVLNIKNTVKMPIELKKLP
jgi:hypothetical protein